MEIAPDEAGPRKLAAQILRARAERRVLHPPTGWSDLDLATCLKDAEEDLDSVNHFLKAELGPKMVENGTKDKAILAEPPEIAGSEGIPNEVADDGCVVALGFRPNEVLSASC